MGIAETYLDKRGAAKRALADLDNMKFILEHTDEKIKMLSAQMEAGDQHSRLLTRQLNIQKTTMKRGRKMV